MNFLVTLTADGHIAYLNFGNHIDPNYSPQFTSERIVEAFVGETYEYVSTATDLDGDSLTFSAGRIVAADGTDLTDQVVFEPTNNGIEEFGTFTWTPTAEFAGQTITVEEIVSDEVNPDVVREIPIYVHPVADNSAPLITSEPDRVFISVPGVSSFDINDLHVCDVDAVDIPQTLTGPLEVTPTSIAAANELRDGIAGSWYHSSG